jgi:hypothetical protein
MSDEETLCINAAALSFIKLKMGNKELKFGLKKKQFG